MEHPPERRPSASPLPPHSALRHRLHRPAMRSKQHEFPETGILESQFGYSITAQLFLPCCCRNIQKPLLCCSPVFAVVNKSLFTTIGSDNLTDQIAISIGLLLGTSATQLHSPDENDWYPQQLIGAQSNLRCWGILEFQDVLHRIVVLL